VTSTVGVYNRACWRKRRDTQRRAGSIPAAATYLKIRECRVRSCTVNPTYRIARPLPCSGVHPGKPRLSLACASEVPSQPGRPSGKSNGHLFDSRRRHWEPWNLKRRESYE